MTNEEILSLTFESSDLSKTVTIRQFIKELARAVWIEQEMFSGKRPFGNSGWTHDVYSCLVKNGLIKGIFDSDGYLRSCNCDDADRLIVKLIESL